METIPTQAARISGLFRQVLQRSNDRASLPSAASQVDSLSRLAFVLLSALAGYAIALFSPAILNDSDTYWHIAAGAWIASHHAVPHTDPFSFTLLGHPWVAHEWLSDLLMAAAYRWDGWSGIVLLFAIAVAVAAALLAYELQRWLPPIHASLLLVFAAVCVAPSFLARPHLLTLPLLVLWTIALCRGLESGGRPSFFALPVMTLWANLHGGYAFGLALCVPMALEAVLMAKSRPAAVLLDWGIFIAAGTGAALLTPNLIGGLLYPVAFVQFKHLAFLNEWESPDLTHLPPILLAAAVFVYFALTRGLRLPATRVLLLLGLGYIALQHARYQLIAGPVGALLLAGPFARSALPLGRGLFQPPIRASRAVYQLTLICLGAAISLAAFRHMAPVQRTDGPTSPISALARVPAELLTKPVFNDFNLGGYLIFRGVRPFIDSRADMYGDDFILSTYAPMFFGKQPALEEGLDRYAVQWTILRASAPAVAVLDGMPGWRRLYSDGFAVVHIRIGANLVSPAGFEPATP